MKMGRILNALLAGLIVFSINCGSDNDQTVTATEAFEALAEYGEVQNEFNRAANSVSDGLNQAETQTSSGRVDVDGPTITVDPFDLTTFPKTITIDFGSTGIEGPDGITRTGKLITESSAWYKTEGSSHVTTFENYFHNEVQIEGKITTSNLGPNESQQPQFDAEVENGQYIGTNGTVQFTRETRRTQTEGTASPINIWDDRFLIDAVENGVSSAGVSYRISTKKTLDYSTLTKVLGGILLVEVDGFDQDIEIDYDLGEIRIGSLTFPIN